jgi:hypothetical protein
MIGRMICCGEETEDSGELLCLRLTARDDPQARRQDDVEEVGGDPQQRRPREGAPGQDQLVEAEIA